MKWLSITLVQARLINDDLQGQGQIRQKAQLPGGQFLLDNSQDPSRHVTEEIHAADLPRSSKRTHSPSRAAHRREVAPRLRKSRAKGQKSNLIHRDTGKQVKENLEKQIAHIGEGHLVKKVRVNQVMDPTIRNLDPEETDLIALSRALDVAEITQQNFANNTQRGLIRFAESVAWSITRLRVYVPKRKKHSKYRGL